MIETAVKCKFWNGTVRTVVFLPFWESDRRLLNLDWWCCWSCWCWGVVNVVFGYVVVVLWSSCCCGCGGVFGIKDCSTNCWTKNCDQRLTNLKCWCWWLCCGDGGGGSLLSGYPAAALGCGFSKSSSGLKAAATTRPQHREWKRNCPKHAKETYIFCI